MTRKTCTDHPHVDIVLQSLCRELDCFDNSYLRPRKAATQQKLRSNSLRFNLCRIDAIIKLFLKTNGITLSNKQLHSIKSSLQLISSQMTRNKMPYRRTRTSSTCYKVKNSSLSPTGSDFGHRLRTRRYTSFVSNYVDTSGDDDSNHVRPMRELRSSTTKVTPAKVAEHDQDTWESGRPKRTCIKQKRISADERLVVDNKNYYKVEVMTNKLRSSGVTPKEHETSTRKKMKSPILTSEDSEEDKVKFKKLRNSELTRLNNEAENFLFPHNKDESSSEEDTDIDTSTPHVNNKKESVPNDSGSKNKVSKAEPEEESSMDSTSSEMSVIRKRRRLTQAEAFILDNQRYYKFETPGSRLRYQGSYLAPIPSKNNGEYGIKQPRCKESPENAKSKLKLEDLKFSFEVVPKTEPWYKTFQRQDVGEECYTCYHYSSGYCKPFLLPYEMGPLPPLDPRVCVYAYSQMKKRFLGDTAPSTSAACSTPDSSSADATGKTDYNSSTGDDTKSSEDSTMESDFGETFFRKSKLLRQTHTRRGLFIASKNPRKSPRQHASTLAILSSLIHQRKRREIHKARVSDPNSKILAAIAEEEKEVQEPEPDYDAIAKNINEMLSNSAEQLNSLELSLSTDSGVNVDVHYKPDIIETLDDYINCRDGRNVKVKSTIKVTTDPVRKPFRKKKKNRTGWPNKNKRTVFRKEGSDSRDGLGGSEHENSIIDSPSVDADSEGNEENSSEDNNSNKRNKNLSLSKLSSLLENTISPNVSKNEGRSANISKINGDVQANKLNGVNDNFELNFKNLGTPRRKEHRESSSDNCAEVVIASVGDKIDCVNVDLAKWENAERVLTAKLRSEAINNDIQFQPIVRVQKLDNSDLTKRGEKRVQVSPSPRRTRPRRMPASPKSPRMLRRPRGGWYRERY